VQSPLQGTYGETKGPSPVTIGLQSSMTLSGLNERGADQSYAFAAVDLAGNEGGRQAPTVQPYLTLRPNQISPQRRARRFTLGPNESRIERIVVDGTLA